MFISRSLKLSLRVSSQLTEVGLLDMYILPETNVLNSFQPLQSFAPNSKWDRVIFPSAVLLTLSGLGLSVFSLHQMNNDNKRLWALKMIGLRK